MNIFKFFKKKKEEVKPIIKEETEVLPPNCVLCNLCKKPIYPHEQRRTFNGHKYHIKCFRKALKSLKKSI
jgi:hypothetical protein